MRGSRFSTAGTTAGKKTHVNSKPPHYHKYKREYVEGSAIISHEDDCEDILECIRHEWKKCGRNRLGIKELRTHHPEGSIVLYHMYNQGNEESIVAEGKRILEKAKEEEGNDAMGDDFK